eukprot:474817-Amphidinium_carterae.2
MSWVTLGRYIKNALTCKESSAESVISNAGIFTVAETFVQGLQATLDCTQENDVGPLSFETLRQKCSVTQSDSHNFCEAALRLCLLWGTSFSVTD